MCCKPACGGVRILNTGGSLVVPTVVKAITTSGATLKVTNTDGSSYDVELPKAAPINAQPMNILNASGTQLVATVAALTQET